MGALLGDESSRRSASPSACAPRSRDRTSTSASSIPVSTETEFFDVMQRETGHRSSRALGPRQPADEVAERDRARDRAARSPEVYPSLQVARPRDRSTRSRPASAIALVKQVRPQAGRPRRREPMTARAAAIEHRARARDRRRRPRRRRPRAHRRRLGPRPAARPRRRRTSTSRCSACRRHGCARCSRRFGRVEAVGESFQVYKIGDIDVVAAAARVEDRAAAIAASTSPAIPT